MSRWIDADALIRSVVEKLYTTNYFSHIIKMIDEAPSIDIVRCKECKHNPKDIGWACCLLTGSNMCKPDDFCSYGERRE